MSAVDDDAIVIADAESAWEAMLDMANGALTTNDPLIAYALVAIAHELRAARLAAVPSS